MVQSIRAQIIWRAKFKSFLWETGQFSPKQLQGKTKVITKVWISEVQSTNSKIKKIKVKKQRIEAQKCK